MKRFEYHTIKIETGTSTDEIDDIMDSWGEDGWELVTAATDNSMDDDGDTYTEYIWYTFKRELDD